MLEYILLKETSPVGYIIGFVVVVMFLIIDFFFSDESIVKRRLRKATEKNIGDVKSGEEVKISGELVLLGRVLKAPLSNRTCAYYHVLIEEKSGGKNSSWYDLVDKVGAADVIIKQGTHYAIIKTNIVKAYVVKDLELSSGFLNDPNEVLENYLAKHGHKPTGLLGFNKTLRYSEGVLEEGETIHAKGKAYWINRSQTQLKIPAEKILVISSTDEDPVYFTDDLVLY